jgi:hypothetical protein
MPMLTSCTTTAPFLCALIPSGTLILPIQVYDHHPRPRIPLYPVHHIIDPGYYLVWAFLR